MKLKNKMLFLIGAPILLVIVILTVVSYIYSKSLLVNESRETMLAYAEKYASDVESIIAEKKSYVEISADNISKEQKKGQALLDDLTYLTQNISGALDVYAGFNDKSFFDGSGWVPDAGFDPTSRSWYQGAIGKNSTYISDPYVTATDNSLVVAVCYELKYNGQSAGVLGADMSMKEFDNLIKNIKLKDTGKASLINKNGGFIISDKYTINDNVTNIENGSLSELAGKLSSGQLEFLSAKTEGVNRFYAIAPVADTDWAVF